MTAEERALAKLEAMKRGETVVTNDQELDIIMTTGDDALLHMRSLPNPDRVGLLDQYVAWIGSERPMTKRRAMMMGAKNDGGLRRYADPGKFEGELHIAQYVYALVMEGWGDTAGDVQEYGHVYNAIELGEDALKRIEEIAKEGGDELTKDEKNLIKDAHGAIMSEGDQGFVSVEFFGKKKKFEDAWDGIESDIEKFYEEQEEEG